MHTVINSDSPYFGLDLQNFETNTDLPRHRWYYFKEGFSSKLVEMAIAVQSEKKTALSVLDPFCGSGTTPLTSALNGHHCTAIEVNPFLKFTATVKSSPRLWRRNLFLEKVHKVVESSTKGSRSYLENFSTFCESPANTKWLFNKSVIRRFTSLQSAVCKHGESYKNILLLSALNAAFESSNVRRDGKALRYLPNWQDLGHSGKSFVELFLKHTLKVIEDVETHPISPLAVPKILQGDSRVSLEKLESNSFDLVVTSPPYLNSFDYSDVYRPELFLGGFVNSNDALRQVRMKTLRSHVQVNWDKETEFQSTILAPVWEKINASEGLWSKRIPLMILAYFDDLNKIFNQVYRLLKSGGHAWIVISTSAYGGEHIPVDLIFAELATKIGFKLDSIHALRELRASGQQWTMLSSKKPPLRESLIILKK
jgi:DNA modification methylase